MVTTQNDAASTPEPEQVAATSSSHSSGFTKPMTLAERMVSPDRAARLNEKYEVMRSRNWITERMIEQTQHHLHITREEALERLLGETVEQ